MADEYIVKVKADTKDAEDSISSLSNSMQGLGGKVALAAAGFFSFQAIKSALTAAINGAVEAEEAVKQLNKALAVSGQYSKEASDSFLQFASSLQKTTGISDDLITKNAALLVSIGKLNGSALERATKAALDLSAGLGIDVSSAFDSVAKASQGSVGALSRYGLEVQKSWSDSQKFSAALSFIENQFGGMSRGSLNTFTGALQNAGNAFNDMFEEVGNKIIKDKSVVVTLNFMADAFYKIADAISRSSFAITPLVQGFITLGSVISQYLLAPLETVIRFMWSNFLNLPLLILGVSQQVGLVLDNLFGTEMGMKIDGIRSKISEMQNQIVSPILGEEEMFSTRFGKSLDELNAKIDKTANDLETKIPNATKKMSASIKKDSIDISNTINNGLAQVVAKGIGTIVENVVKGKSAFSNLAAGIAQVMGDLAIQIGTMMMALGIGIAAIIAGGLNPVVLIAAGAGLVAIGAALKALASGADGNSVAGGIINPANTGGVAGGESSYGSEFPEAIDDRERNAPNTGVQVIVQGNILDRRETGLAIAEIINESFNTNGVTISATA